MKMISKAFSRIKLPLLAFVLAAFFGGILIALSEREVLPLIGSPWKFFTAALHSAGNAYLALFQGSIFDTNLVKDGSLLSGFYPLSETLLIATPLILTGLSVTLAFKAGLFNIGAQGQFIFGAIGASYIGFSFNFSPVIHVLLALITAIVFSAMWGGFVGLLKARTGAHEVIVTIMFNYIAGFFLFWLLKTKVFLRPGGLINPLAPPVHDSAKLPQFLGSDLRANAGIFIAILATYFVWWLLNRSTWGFRFRAVGANASAARTAGISVAFVTTTAMAVSGALAGLGGAIQVLGSEFALTTDVAGSFGFDAITVALLGRANPVGTVVAALLFGALRAGGLTMQANTQNPVDIVLVIQALIVLFISAPTLVKFIFRLRDLKTGSTVVSKGWNG